MLDCISARLVGSVQWHSLRISRLIELHPRRKGYLLATILPTLRNQKKTYKEYVSRHK